MVVKLTHTAVRNLEPKKTIYDVRDSETKGFLIRVRPSGLMVYYLVYRNAEGTQKFYKIGTHGNLTVTQARDIAKKKAAEVVSGIDIQLQRKEKRLESKRAKLGTLGGFIEEKYADYLKAHRKSHHDALLRLEANFSHLYGRPFAEINKWVVTKWRTERRKQGVSIGTLERDIAELKRALTLAVEWKIIEAHPLKDLEPLKFDPSNIVRFLSENEEIALFKALRERGERNKKKRDSGNRWRRERGREELPSLAEYRFADHLEPTVILSLNTGIRRGELFNLKWSNVNFHTRILTIEGTQSEDSTGTKSRKTRYIPLNDTAIEALAHWQNHADNNEDTFVFPAKDGGRLDNINSAWRKLIADAGIKRFRWHDMRHDFASKLVMAGVPLNTVRELMGHASLTMTLRYAHLAESHKVEAVGMLDRKVIPITQQPKIQPHSKPT